MTEQENLHESAEGYGNELVTMSRGVSFNFVIFFSSLTLFFICCCCFDTRNPFFLPGCADSNVQCPEWAKLDECFNNPQWMKRNCRFSCEQCQEPQIEVRLWWPFFSLLSWIRRKFLTVSSLDYPFNLFERLGYKMTNKKYHHYLNSLSFNQKQISFNLEIRSGF